MKKIRNIDVRFSVDEEKVLEVSGQKCLEDAIAQELQWVQESGLFVDSWRFEKERSEELAAENFEGQVLAALGQIKGMHPLVSQIAMDMEYLQREVELTDREAFLLAQKLDDAHGTWFQQPLLHGEYLEALRTLLDEGLRNDYFDMVLTPEEAKQLLLSADNVVFGTVVEAVAVENSYRYAPDDFVVDIDDARTVRQAAESVREKIGSIEGAIEKAATESENYKGFNAYDEIARLTELKKERPLTEDEWETLAYCKNATAEQDYYDSLE